MAAIAFAIGPAGAATGQVAVIDPAHPDEKGLRDAARTADVGTGEVGQRQTREEAAPGIEPMARIANRIENRIENRIRSRIDREHEEDASAASAITGAQSQLRGPSLARPRPRAKGR